VARYSLIKPKLMRSPRYASAMLALGHQLFKQLGDKVIQSRPLSPFYQATLSLSFRSPLPIIK